MTANAGEPKQQKTAQASLAACIFIPACNFFLTPSAPFHPLYRSIPTWRDTEPTSGFWLARAWVSSAKTPTSPPHFHPSRHPTPASIALFSDAPYQPKTFHHFLSLDSSVGVESKPSSMKLLFSVLGFPRKKGLFCAQYSATVSFPNLFVYRPF